MITTRLATVDDELAVRTLIRQAISNTKEYTAEVKEKELSFHSAYEIEARIKEGLTVIAISDGEVCGVCIGEDEGGVIWLGWIAVMPEYQRRGIGRSLLTKFINTVKGEDTGKPLGHKISCSMLQSNAASNELFYQMRFFKVASLWDHWHHLDFHLRELHLQKRPTP